MANQVNEACARSGIAPASGPLLVSFLDARVRAKVIERIDAPE
jgi:hypothetical protein